MAGLERQQGVQRWSSAAFGLADSADLVDQEALADLAGRIEDRGLDPDQIDLEAVEMGFGVR